MELHCPHCQKQLIIEDQYAGQPMKCPMCDGTFDAPSMPSYSASESSLPSPPEQAPSSGGMPPPPSGELPPQQFDPSQAPMPEQPAAPPQPPYEEPVRSTTYKSQCSLYFSPSIIQWIVVGAMVLIFLLSFFPWVSFGYPGIWVFSQNGWQAAFGGSSVNESLGANVPSPKGDDGPGVSVLSIFYLLLLIVTLLLVTGAAILNILKLNLAPGLRMFLNFKWVIAGSLVFLTFFLLLLQVLTGFSAESKVYEQAAKAAEMTGGGDDSSPEVSLQSGMFTAGLQRGFALTWVFRLHLLAVLASAFICWMDLRKTAPIPKLEFHW